MQILSKIIYAGPIVFYRKIGKKKKEKAPQHIRQILTVYKAKEQIVKFVF
jgi:hypothetical protein